MIVRLHTCLCTFAVLALGRQQGLCDQWLSGASLAIKIVSETVNGPLLAELARRIGQENVECVEFSAEVSVPMYVCSASLYLPALQGRP